MNPHPQNHRFPGDAAAIVVMEQTRALWSERLIGITANGLTVEAIDFIRRNGRTRWQAICKCACGKTTRKEVSQVWHRRAKSCGCSLARRGADHPNWKGGRDIPANYFQIIKSRARKAGIHLSITLQDMQEIWDSQRGLCFYTHWPLSWAASEDIAKPSLDRRDPSLGYAASNVVFSSWLVNRIKNNLDSAAFINLCAAVSSAHPAVPRSPAAGDYPNTQVSRNYPRLKAEEVVEIHALFSAGMTRGQLVRKFKKSYASIRRVLSFEDPAKRLASTAGIE